MAYPDGVDDERELFLQWLGFLRSSLLGKVEGLSDQNARWTPEGRLVPLIGIVNHVTQVEWRWIDGVLRGETVSRSEEEFNPQPDVALDQVVAAYRERASATDETVRTVESLDVPCVDLRAKGKNLRWVLIHLVEETARHAGHADAVRELLDGTTGI